MERPGEILVRPAEARDRLAVEKIQLASAESATWNAFDYEVFVAESNGSVAGFAVIRRILADEHELLNLAVDPPLRRRGIARALLGNLLAARPGLWALEVRESNRTAQDFYRNLGFAQAGHRPGYYPNGPGGGPEPGIVFLLRTC